MLALEPLQIPKYYGTFGLHPRRCFNKGNKIFYVPLKLLFYEIFFSFVLKGLAQKKVAENVLPNHSGKQLDRFQVVRNRLNLNILQPELLV